MDEPNKQQSVGGTGAPQGSGTPAQPQQSAQEDLKKVADRAKAATTGFSFDKLFAGRLDEVTYLYFAIGSIVVGFMLMMIPIIVFLVSLGVLVIGLGATARRLRDIGMEPLFAATLIIPFVGFILVVYLCWKMGDVGPNKYGNPPNKKRELFSAILNT